VAAEQVAWRQVTNLKVIIAVIIAALLGAVGLVYGSSGTDLPHNAAEVLGGVIFPVAIVALIYELWLR
jgi:hypothetical protein